MPFWKNPTTGNLYRNPGGGIFNATQEELEACCCDEGGGEVVITSCADFEDALDVSGTTANLDIEVEIGGMANGSCSDCGDYNTIHLFTVGTYDPPPGNCFYLAQPGLGFCSGLNFYLTIVLNPSDDSGWFEAGTGGGGGATIWWVDYSAGNMLAALSSFFSGDDITLSVSFNDTTRCDGSSSTCVVRVA